MFGRSRDRLLWQVLGATAAAAAAMVARAGIRGAWKVVRKGDPPENPVERGVGWGDALAWGAAIGVAGGLSRVVGRRAAAAAWKETKGGIPS
jgi:hypothetical protein